MEIYVYCYSKRFFRITRGFIFVTKHFATSKDYEDIY